MADNRLEKVRKEVESRLNTLINEKEKWYNNFPNNPHLSGEIIALKHVLNIIDSMQKEPQVRKYKCLHDYYLFGELRSYTAGKIYEVLRDDQGIEWITNDNGHSELFGYFSNHFELVEDQAKIIEGNYYLCLADIENRDTGCLGFKKGKIYYAPRDNVLKSDENGWLCDMSENPSGFELVEEPENKIGEIPPTFPLISQKEDSDNNVVMQHVKAFIEMESRKEAIEREMESRHDYNTKAKRIEDPVSEDLEKEMDNYIENNFYGSGTQGFFSNRTHEELDCIDVVNIARHFANWQKKKDEKERQAHKIYKEGKKAGMRYARQLMMKDAVEGEILMDNRGINYVSAKVTFNPQYCNHYKVKVLIIKEDRR